MPGLATRLDYDVQASSAPRERGFSIEPKRSIVRSTPRPLTGVYKGFSSFESPRQTLKPLSMGLAGAMGTNPAVLRASSKAVAKLASSCGVGYYLSRKGVLDQQALTSLSKLIFYVFQPCLLFVNVAQALSIPGQNLSKLAVLPAFACAQIALGAIVGSVLVRALSIDSKSDEGREVKMCSAFANSGPLPLLFVDSIFLSHADPTLLPSAVAYISFYLLGWSPMFWTAGYSILANKAPPASLQNDIDKGSLNILQRAVVEKQELAENPTVKRILSPPVLGCILGALVGVTPALRSMLVGAGAPLSPIFESLRSLGTAYLPAAILVLSGSLAGPKPEGGTSAARQEQEKVASGFARKIMAVMLARFAIMPVGAYFMLRTGSSMGLIPYDKLLWFVLLMEGCMPSAQNSVLILNLERKAGAATSMARTLSTVYLFSVVPIALLLTTILNFVRL
ncbi:unnamed protein product [Chrysoparadoxa australica]